MFGTEIEFFCILGTGCFSTARSFLSSLDWLVPFLFLFFFFFFSRDVAVDGMTAVLPGCLPRVVTAA